jgi:hypothetical protein
MKTQNKTIRRNNIIPVHPPKDKLQLFNESNEIYPPLISERNRNKKDFSFIVDWQMEDTQESRNND